MRIIDHLSAPQPRRTITLVAFSLMMGLGTGYFLSRHDRPVSIKPDAPIEWKKVQAIPRRAPDVEDKDWQERADALDDPRPVTANRAGASENAAD
jgi:hypothetical protein